MNVGQVEFSIRVDGIEQVLAKLQQVENLANKLDGRTLSNAVKNAGTAMKQTAKDITTAGNNLQKQSKDADRIARQNIKRQNLGIRERIQAGKRVAKIERQQAQASDKMARQSARLGNLRLKERIATAKRIAKVESAAERSMYGEKLAGVGDRFRQMQKAFSGLDQKKYLEKATNQAKRYDKAIGNINQTLATNQNLTDNQRRYLSGVAKAYRTQSGLLKASVRDMQQVNKATQTTTAGMTDANQKMTDYKSLVDNRTRSIAQWGSRMQTLGNSMQRVSSPFFSVFRGVAMGIGYKMLGKFMNSLSGAAQRYDTMRTYANVLGEIGINADKTFKVFKGQKTALTAIDNLEQSVLGLPTGLDEIVASMRTYAGITNDVEKATKMAIAANNAFIAGGMDETRTRMAERQLQNLLSNGQLTAMQWNSLQKNMPLAFNAVGKELGYTNKNIKKFLADLKTGKVTAEEFVDAFIKVGTEGRVNEAAQKMKMTWEAVSQNISNAFNRMGSNILTSLDEVFTKVTGRDFLQTVLGVDKNGNAVGGGIKDFIDGISESVQGFIKANPDKIVGFFDRLKSIDWKGILTGYGDVIKFYANLISGMMKVFGGRNLIVMMAGVNLFGKLFGVVGSLARGLAGPIARLSLLMGGGGRLATFFATMTGLAPQMEMMATSLAGVRWTTNRLAAFHMMSDMAITMRKLSILQSAVRIGQILAVAHSFKVVVGAMKELQDVKMSPNLIANMATAGGAIAGMVKAMSVIGTAISTSKVAMIGTGIASGAALAISKSIDWVASGMKKVAEAINIVSEMKLPSMKKVEGVAERAKKLSSSFRSINPFEAIGKMLDAISMNTETNAIKNMAEAIDSIDKVSKSKLNKTTLKKAFRNFSTLMDFANEITKTFAEGEEGLMKRGNTLAEQKGQKAAGKKYKSYAKVKGQVRDFGETIQSIAEALNGMGDIITNSQAFEKKYAEIAKHTKRNTFDWQHVKDHIGTIADALYGIIDSEEGSGFQKLNEVSKQLKGSDFTRITALFTEVPKMLDAISESHDDLLKSSLFQKHTAFDKEGKSVQETAFDDIARQMGIIGRSLGKIKKSFPKGEVFETSIGNIIGKFKKIPSLLNTLKTTYDKVKNNELLKKQEAWDKEGKGITVTPLGEFTETMESLGKDLTTISDSLPDGEEFKTNIGGITASLGGIKDIFKALAEITSGSVTGGKKLKIGDISNMSSILEQFSLGLSALNEAFTDIENVGKFGEKVSVLNSTVMTPFKSIFTSLVNMQTMMNDSNVQAVGAPQQTISLAITDLMNALSSLNTSITDLGDMSEFVGNVSQLNAAMNYVKSVFVKIDEIKTLINGEQGGGIGADLGLSSIGSTISRVIQEISDATMKAPVVLVGATMLQGAFSALRSAFSKLNGIALNAETSATTITTAINTLESIGNKIINISITIAGTVTDGGIPAQIRAVANSITLALAQIKSSYERKVSVKVKGTVSDGGVPAKIRQVALAIRLAAAAIPTNISRHVNVSITGTVTKDIPISTGGLIRGAGQTPIYRKMGGFAFQPKGTDTVPAMLTPGEYVVRRKAVDTFGARFLQRINHLDVKGALNALSIKAGQSILPSRSTVINNHTNNYNNVNLGGITNNNPRGEVGLVKAGRMIHALQH